VGEVLVGGDGLRGCHRGGRNRGANDVQAVDGGIAGDACLVAGIGERLVGDREAEVLADLMAVQDPATRRPISARPRRGRRGRCVAAATFTSSFSVAQINASRVRARSSASHG